jgi:O-antigen/teichoic acid export membrane protein
MVHRPNPVRCTLDDALNTTPVTIRERLLVLAPPLRPHWELLRGSPMGYRLARGAFWSLAGTAISRGLTLVSSVLVARMLGKEGFGQLGIIQTTIGMFGVFAGFGMGLAATKHVAEYRSEDPQRAGRIIVFMELVTIVASSVVLGLLICSARFLAQHTLAATQLAPLLLLGGLLLPFSALNGVQTGSLSGLEAFRTIAKVNLLTGVLSLPFIVLGAYASGITGAVLGLIASQMANCFLTHQAVRREAKRFGISLRLATSAQDWKLLRDFSLPAVLSNSVGWGANWACSAILVNQANGYAQMGLVNVGNQWRAALMFLPGLLLNATLPMLASENKGSSQNFGRALGLAHKLISMLVVPITLVLMLASGWILNLYGHGFRDGRAALVHLLAAAAISAVSSPAGSAIVATGKMWLSVALNMSNAAVFVSLTWWLAPTRGAEGLSLAFFAGNIFQALAGYIYLRQRLPAGMFTRNLALLAIISLAAFGILQVF